jgi:hypothetical protein
MASTRSAQAIFLRAYSRDLIEMCADLASMVIDLLTWRGVPFDTATLWVFNIGNHWERSVDLIALDTGRYHR